MRRSVAVRSAAAAAGGAVIAVAGAGLLWFGLRPGYAPPPLAPPPAASAATVPPGTVPPGTVPTGTASAGSVPAVRRTVPARVVIPAIGVDAPIVPEGTDGSGALEMPSLAARNVAAWWDGGAAPGQDGPAVIAGHVDSAQAGPLVFWKLRLLKPGDIVETEPGALRFEVTAVTQVDKTRFPTLDVYGPTRGPQLRLITCGGSFDPATGHYLSNVIAYATEVKA